VALAVTAAFSCFSARAQMYSQDLHDQSRWRGAHARPQQPFGGMGVDSTSAFLQRRDEEERERRDMRERQRRMMENFTNIPDQLRQPYSSRPDLPYSSR
jgi:hypothetical protein